MNKNYIFDHKYNLHHYLAALDNIPVMNGLLPAYVKQATAAKAIRILCKTSMAVTESILQLNVVPNLMFAMGNTEYCSSQKEASLTLEVISFYCCRWLFFYFYF